MKRSTGRTLKTAILFLILSTLAAAQAPTGNVAGVVRDPSGAAVTGAHMKLQNPATGLVRAATTSAEGDYGFSALLAGDYEVSVDAPGFRSILRTASVEAGSTTTADFVLRVGEAKDSVTVDGASPQINYDSHAIGGVITSSQIQELPLNGRSFLELAKLEPGAQPPTRASNNRLLVPVLGAPGGQSGRGTRVTVDGGSVMAVGNGGSSMGFSQEVVQEFQISTVNFDLSTGLTADGAVNVVTRSGSNDLHGAAFYFFRDHNLAAYPALNRDPANPDPFFQRRQFGVALGGPIHHDRLFFFGNWERNEQRGVLDTTLVGPDLAHFSRITPSPLFGDQLSIRLDARLTNSHSVFVRHSHDGSGAYGPSSLFASGNAAYPSQWTRQQAWADQSMLGLTSIVRPTLVNDLRFSYFFISSNELPPTEQDCPGCLGIGAPTINISQASLFLGDSASSYNLGRRFHLNDSVSWQKSTHRVRVGGDWEHLRGGLVQSFNQPATLTLFAPDQVRAFNASPQTPANLRIPLLPSFNSLSDILQLPLQSVTVGIGDPRVPQQGGGNVRRWNTVRLFVQDTWRLHERLTMNYGLSWNFDHPLNYDLSKPALLAPLLGTDGLGPTRKQWKNLSPTLGFAWAPSRDGKTVIRTGAGIFYDFLVGANLDLERAALGGTGFGSQNIAGSSIANPLPGIAGVPVGKALNFTGAPTLFTGANLVAILPAVRAGLAQNLANSDSSAPAIKVTKQLSGQLGALYPADFPSSSGLHASAGVQREIARDFVLSADFVYRHFVHLGMGANGIDLNHFNSIRGPVIPVCSAAQKSDPQAICSLGPFNVQEAAARATYKGLLLRADKRFSHGFQVLGSYAYSSDVGITTGSGFNLDNWLQNQGPLGNDNTQILNLAGVTRLPWHFELGLNFSYSSAPPFSAFVGGIDFNGDGTTGDLLPGTTANAFNRGLGREDLVLRLGEFNQTYGGTTDSHGRPIPRITLPGQYSFGKSFQSLDLRVSRSFVFRDRWHLSIIAEGFNLYNAANLSGYSGDLTNSAAFGQPTSRATQIFGSGGPRAFQLGARVGF